MSVVWHLCSQQALGSIVNALASLEQDSQLTPEQQARYRLRLLGSGPVVTFVPTCRLSKRTSTRSSQPSPPQPHTAHSSADSQSAVDRTLVFGMVQNAWAPILTALQFLLAHTEEEVVFGHAHLLLTHSPQHSCPHRHCCNIFCWHFKVLRTLRGCWVTAHKNRQNRRENTEIRERSVMFCTFPGAARARDNFLSTLCRFALPSASTPTSDQSKSTKKQVRSGKIIRSFCLLLTLPPAALSGTHHSVAECIGHHNQCQEHSSAQGPFQHCALLRYVTTVQVDVRWLDPLWTTGGILGSSWVQVLQTFQQLGA